MCELCNLKAALREQILEEQAEDQVQLNASLLESKVNINNATAINKLVEAADVLGSMGKGELADRVLVALGKILPQREERRTGQTTPGEEPQKAKTTADPMRWAEGLIRQLPTDHDGRNSWLLNHGSSIVEEPSKAYVNTTNQVNEAASLTNQPIVEAPVDEFAGLPAQLKAYVEEMRAKGFEVELIDMSKL